MDLRASPGESLLLITVDYVDGGLRIHSFEEFDPGWRVLRWTRAGEDLFDVLVDGATVTHIEISRRNPGQETVFEARPVEDYRLNQEEYAKLCGVAPRALAISRRAPARRRKVHSPS